MVGRLWPLRPPGSTRRSGRLEDEEADWSSPLSLSSGDHIGVSVGNEEPGSPISVALEADAFARVLTMAVNINIDLGIILVSCMMRLYRMALLPEGSFSLTG